MKKLIILGGTGIGMIAASVATDIGNIEVLGFLNDFEKKGTLIGKFRKFPILGKSEKYIDFAKDKDVSFFIGYVGMQKEEETYRKIKSLSIPEDRIASLIHPTAVVPYNFSKIGYGVMMAPYCQLSPDTTISNHCIMLGNSFLGHDSFLDEFAHLATNSVVGANVKVGKACHVGSNSTIREKVIIGDFSLIGAGSVVLKDVSEKCIVVGNPARVLKTKKRCDMSFGRFFEDFIIGQTIHHDKTKTILESDNNIFSLITMNHHPVHLDVEYCKNHQHEQILVVGTLVFSLAVGITVSDISGKAIANLDYETVTHNAPVFIGDTIKVETEILDKRESKSKNDRGIVYVESRVYNQENIKVLTFRRHVLIPKER